MEFLKNYTSVKKIFSRVKLAKAKMYCDVAKQRTQQENEQLLVEWVNNEVLIAGPKQDVKAKLKEIEKDLANTTTERYYCKGLVVIVFVYSCCKPGVGLLLEYLNN